MKLVRVSSISGRRVAMFGDSTIDEDAMVTRVRWRIATELAVVSGLLFYWRRRGPR